MIDTNEQLEIPLSKKKLLFMFLGSVGFVVAGVWFLINPPNISNPVFGNPVFILCTCIASVVFFGTCAVYILRKLQDSRPGMIIDHLGFADNSSGLSAGEVKWDEIEHISILEIHRQKLVMVFLKNPEDFMSRQKVGLKQKLMQMNLNAYGTPISISAHTLKIDYKELLQLLESHLDRSRQ